jgi:hypothetical protein
VVTRAVSYERALSRRAFLRVAAARLVSRKSFFERSVISMTLDVVSMAAHPVHDFVTCGKLDQM